MKIFKTEHPEIKTALKMIQDLGAERTLLIAKYLCLLENETKDQIVVCDYLTACKLAGVKKTAIYRWKDKGYIKMLSNGMFCVKSLFKYMAKRKQNSYCDSKREKSEIASQSKN